TIVSHTPVETEALDALLAGNHGWTALGRKHLPYRQKRSAGWDYRALCWEISSPALRLARTRAPTPIPAPASPSQIGPVARGWTKKPSDHVPVIAHFGGEALAP